MREGLLLLLRCWALHRAALTELWRISKRENSLDSLSMNSRYGSCNKFVKVENIQKVVCCMFLPLLPRFCLFFVSVLIAAPMQTHITILCLGFPSSLLFRGNRSPCFDEGYFLPHIHLLMQIEMLILSEIDYQLFIMDRGGTNREKLCHVGYRVRKQRS